MKSIMRQVAFSPVISPSISSYAFMSDHAFQII
jgi:hypothetical protein